MANACPQRCNDQTKSALLPDPSISDPYSQVGGVIVARCHVVEGIQRLGGRWRGLREGTRQTGQEDRRQQDSRQCPDCHGCTLTALGDVGWKSGLAVLLRDPMSVTEET